MFRALDVASAYLVSGLRLAYGLNVGPLGPRPEQRLILYEFEACPFCRKVRETLCYLDLEAEIRPCPKNGPRFREEVKAKGGKAQFPYLVDPNTNSAMYESDDIIRHLTTRYGTGKFNGFMNSMPMTMLTGPLSGALRGSGGSQYRKARAPTQPLELYSSENSPFCRIVRETLCELELPYLLHNVAHGSPSRPAFVTRSGKQMVPFLIDPNTNAQMFESADIKAYLNRTYAI